MVGDALIQEDLTLIKKLLDETETHIRHIHILLDRIELTLKVTEARP